VVATRYVAEGEGLVWHAWPPDNADLLEEIGSVLRGEYWLEISELGSYIEMACGGGTSTSTSTSSLPSDSKRVDAVGVSKAAAGGREATTTAAALLGPFHRINHRYLGLRLLHCDSDIYEVEDILLHNECNRIVAKAIPCLTPCVVANEVVAASAGWGLTTPTTTIVFGPNRSCSDPIVVPPIAQARTQIYPRGRHQP
jgi:hypothetical protein